MSTPLVRSHTPPPWPEVPKPAPEPVATLSRTLGDILDRFCTASWKLYQLQDEIHLAARENRGLTPEQTRKGVDLNLERNRLMTDFERAIFSAVRTGHVYIDPRTKMARGLESQDGDRQEPR